MVLKQLRTITILDNLDYLWVQLDQNQQAKDSESPLLKVKG
jgi:hypothetical protein